MPEDDPRCPECGGPIGQTSTYCMHCSADLTDLRAGVDGQWGEADTESQSLGVDEAQSSGTGPVAPGDDESDLDAPSDLADVPAYARPSSSGMEDGHLYPPDLHWTLLWVLAALAGGVVVATLASVGLRLAAGTAVGIVGGFLTWIAATWLFWRLRPE